MNPETKLIIDEIACRFNEHDLKWDACFADQDMRLSRQIRDLEQAQEGRLAALEKVAASLDEWRPSIEGIVDDLKSDVSKSKLEVSKISRNWERAILDQPAPTPGVFASAPPTPERPFIGAPSNTPNGPCVDNHHRESGFGVLTTQIHSPVKGMPLFPSYPSPRSVLQSNDDPGPHSGTTGVGHNGFQPPKLPKFDFPKFDRSQPKYWLSQCKDYFELYGTDQHMWVRVAKMHFTHAAKRWYPSVESQLQNVAWPTFTKLILARFGQDEHELLLRQLFQIRQTQSVQEYIDQFVAIVDDLSAYGGTIDPLYFAMRFVDGLKDYIRAAVALHRPQNLDTACLLAKLQEEVVDPGKKRDYRRGEQLVGPRPFAPRALPLPPPPPRPALSAPELNRPLADGGRGPTAEERWTALRAARRAQGLCMRCGGRWALDHQCPPQVQLHVVQELLDILHIDDDVAAAVPAEEPPPEQVFLQLSLAAISGTVQPRTICFWGTIGNQHVKILLDSGSSHTFISTSIAAHCSGIQQLPVPLQVQVANGEVLTCSSYIPAASWSIHHCQFTSDLKILPLTSYDMILGLDWLEAHSPMEVHWGQKWIYLPHQGGSVHLVGILPELPVGAVMQLCSVENREQSANATHAPEIQQLLTDYSDLFDPPTQLPPSRSYDHSIPLLPGAAPVYSRPYRFSPAIKDEVEKQVKEMLASGIIQKSTSPFSSAVLLVKKKDNTWRFCVDYRQLNAITVKGKYPVPIIDELLDELSGSSWFTKLDLRSGFHQILLKPGEEFKTAFQTHFGQFEFRVMPFGLTGAPGTFQDAMNSTLAPFLRKFILIFFDDILVYSKSYEDHLLHLALVFQQLQAHSWKIKMSKCEFAKRSIAYLGHVITPDGVTTDPQKVSAIVSWSIPQNVKDLRGFLGLAGYYRKFVRNFGILAKPLTELLRKNTLFVWTQLMLLPLKP
jgi:hypothetical protein